MAFSYGSCQSYYVEEDQPAPMPIQQTKKHTENLNYQCQVAIGEALSYKDKLEYAEDQLQHMFQMEVCYVVVL
jgi:hypothetical protein